MVKVPPLRALLRVFFCDQRPWNPAWLSDTDRAVGSFAMPVQRSAPLDHSLEFAGYDLVRCLGRGGMGEVWSVVRRGLYDGARPLAIKVLLPELSDDVQFRGIFVREGRISMQLSSANIVPVIELGLHDGLLFMVMERVDGVNLAEFQRRSRNVHTLLPLDVVGYIIGEILSALFAAHEHVATGRPAGVIHRDVKPGNILMSSTGDVRLIDFGIARPLTRDASRQMPNGTWRYMAPEQARGFAERGSDLFAVGIIFHELLSGTPFRPRGLSTEQYYRLVTDYHTIPPLERIIPPDLERLRQGLLHPDPRRRYRSAADAMQCLSEWPGYGFARPKVVRVYENAIGTRSSGFTDAHIAAPPSFLLQRKSSLTDPRGTPAGDNTIIFRRPDARASVIGADDGGEVDEDAKTSLRRPWLRRARRMSLRQAPEHPSSDRTTPSPILARKRSDCIGPHPVAAEPPSFTRREPAAKQERGCAITPTLQLVLPVELEEQPSQRYYPKTARCAVVGREPPMPTAETEHKDPPGAASVSGSIDVRDRSSPTRVESAEAETTPPAREGSGRTPLSVLLALVVAAIVGALATWGVVGAGCSTSVEARQ